MSTSSGTLEFYHQSTPHSSLALMIWFSSVRTSKVNKRGIDAVSTTFCRNTKVPQFDAVTFGDTQLSLQKVFGQFDLQREGFNGGNGRGSQGAEPSNFNINPHKLSFYHTKMKFPDFSRRDQFVSIISSRFLAKMIGKIAFFEDLS